MAQKIKHERFRWHNFQWLEMMTGESLYEEDTDELDEDYLDPNFLHTAAELYNNPDLYYEMQSQIESAHMHGHGAIHPPSSSMPGTTMIMSPGGYPLGMKDNFDSSSGGGASRTRTLSSSYNGPLSATRQLAPWSEEFGTMDELDERDQGTLSPRQHALLMQSMQEPLAMYASTLDSSGHGTYLETGGNVYEGDSEELGFAEGGLSFGIGSSGGSNRQRWKNPASQSQGFAPSYPGPGSGQTMDAMDDFDVSQITLYSPGAGRYNPSPTYNYTAPGGVRFTDEHGGNTIMLRSPMPPPRSSEGMFEYGDELDDLHPAMVMSGSMGYGGGPDGPQIHMPAPPPSRNRSYRPPTRPGY